MRKVLKIIYKWLRGVSWILQGLYYIELHGEKIMVILLVFSATLGLAVTVELIRAAMVILCFFVIVLGLTVLFWRKYTAGDVSVLIPRLKELGDLLKNELKSGNPASVELCRAITKINGHLKALNIKHPNFHNLSAEPIGAWLLFVDILYSALERGDMREARTALKHIDVPLGLRPL